MDTIKAFGTEALDWAKRQAGRLLPWAAAIGVLGCEADGVQKPDTKVQDDITERIHDAMADIVTAGNNGKPAYVERDPSHKLVSVDEHQSFKCGINILDYSKECTVTDITGATLRDVGDSMVSVKDDPSRLLELDQHKTKLKLSEARTGETFLAKLGPYNCDLVHETGGQVVGRATVGNDVCQELMGQFGHAVEDFLRGQKRAMRLKDLQIAQLDF
ncbi:MAG: hypothetical protein AAB373_04625 [Patescibacteria group bacterium]|mgnify:CR=1 FL=1